MTIENCLSDHWDVRGLCTLATWRDFYLTITQATSYTLMNS